MNNSSTRSKPRLLRGCEGRVPETPISSFILATAGHVDHGKSALVKALTGVDPDRLPEEKARGITIELGFAELLLPSPPSVMPAARYRVGVVDVPGHEDFVRNMVAGVGSVDLALLVVAADDGWMPQTEEHLEILEYLGVRNAVVALTKIDLAENETEAVTRVREMLRGSAFCAAEIVPTSIVAGRGIDALRDSLARRLAETPAPRDLQKPRLPVDRVFSLKGAGTIVTGTLIGGRLKRGETVQVMPGEAPARIRSIQTHNREVESASPGSRVALNLPDLEPATGRRTRARSGTIARGDVVAHPGVGKPTALFDALVHQSPRRSAGGNAPAAVLRHGMRVQVHHGSGASPARLQIAAQRSVGAGESSVARLALEPDESLLVYAGDRFVLRDWPERQTLAGGVVLDPHPRGKLSDPSTARFLAARSEAPLDPAVLVLTQVERDVVVEATGLLAESLVHGREIEQAVQQLCQAGKIIAAGGVLAEANCWKQSRERAMAIIDAHHREHPEQAGLELNSLRGVLLAELRLTVAAEAMLAELSGSSGFEKTNSVIRRRAHKPALPARLRPAGEKLRAALSANPFDPPSRKELLKADPLASSALKFLVINGEAIEFGAEGVLASEALGEAVRIIRSHLRQNGSATVSELKAVLRSSRRVMVPLLEKLDRDGVTRREGDRRTLKT